MHLGYITNGLADHDLLGGIEIIAALGYRAVGITLDHHKLNPYDSRLSEQLEEVRGAVQRHGLLVVVETGARYLLDPWRKHQPTLVSPTPEERRWRLDFLKRAVDIAAKLDAHALSFWSGALTDRADRATIDRRLVESINSLIEYAAERQVRLAFEPEPGMAIDTMASFAQLLEALDTARVDHSSVGLTVDVGHLHCMGEVPIANVLRNWSDRLRNLHIEDMRAGVHEHLMFGEGQIDFPPIFDMLRRVNYKGPVLVELSRHSPTGPDAARQAMEFLRPLI